MYRAVFVIALLSFAFALGASNAEAVMGPFMGSGFQWFRDADGDGIPNHLDDDWIRPQDGTGYQMKHGRPLSNTCSSFDAAGPRDRDRLRDGTNDRTHLRLKDGSCNAAGPRDRDRLRDGTNDRTHLRLKDGSCK
jgi:hypothetical protein